MSTSVYEKNVADTFYHTAAVGAETLIISYELEKGKILGKTELKFDILDAGELFIYLNARKFISQKMVDIGWIPASSMPK